MAGSTSAWIVLAPELRADTARLHLLSNRILQDVVSSPFPMLKSQWPVSNSCQHDQVGIAEWIAVGPDSITSLHIASFALLQQDNEVSLLRFVLDVAEPLFEQHYRISLSELEDAVLQLSLKRMRIQLTVDFRSKHLCGSTTTISLDSLLARYLLS